MFPLSFSISKPAAYPVFQETLGASSLLEQPNSNNLPVSAKAAVIMDDESKVILFSKNENFRFSMASTTKIMTALTALEHFKLDDVLTVKTNHVEGSVVGFPIGEKVLFEDLLYAMLLPSANDAAVIIAQNYKGGQEAFVAKMNGNAQKWHLSHTHFADPAGLIDEGDYTTVVDLARLCSIAVKNEIVSRIMATKYKTITSVAKSKSYSLTNLNRLLGTNGVNGIKTGYTEEAGGVLTTSTIYTDLYGNKHRLILVVMKSNDRFLDTQTLLSATKNSLVYKQF